MSTHSPANSDKLPPGTNCVVCGDLATGKHYSVPSCNGCKTFFRRAIVNNRAFTCMGNGQCPIDKGVRCACRSCRLEKCIQVGMDPNAIQSERDRIGYTKRTRRDKLSEADEPTDREKSEISEDLAANEIEAEETDEEDITFCGSKDLMISEPGSDTQRSKSQAYEGVLERLTQLENNFTLLLSRSEVHPYASLNEALAAPSRFSQPVNVKLSDPIVQPKPGFEQKMPFWRSRIIALYIDWAKTFSAFRKLPYSDKVALITNHASSYMIMCEAFRTPELINDDQIINGIEKIAEKLPRDTNLVREASRLACDDSAPESLKLGMKKTLSTCAEPPEKILKIGGQQQPEVRTDSVAKSTNGSPGLALGDSSSSTTPMLSSSLTSSNTNIHTFFDPQLIRDGKDCLQTGVRSVVDVPPDVHYPAVGNLSGLTPVMAAMIDCVMKPFRKLNISTTEFAALQAIMFFDPDTEGLDAASQRNICAEQKKMICALYSHICQFHEPAEAEQRFSAILLRIPMIRKVAAKKNESLQIIDLFNLFTLNSLVKETTLGIKGNNGTPTPSQESGN